MTYVALGLALLVVFGVVAVLMRRRKRKKQVPLEVLEPATESGGDITYPYYVNEQELRNFAQGLMVQMPVKQQVVEADQLGASTKGAEVTGSQEVTTEVGTEINLASLARKLRSVGAPQVIDDLALIPPDGDGRRAAETAGRAELVERKREELALAAGGNKLIVLRGHLMKVESADESGEAVTLKLTHLSSESLQPDTYPGVGNAAETVMPDELEVHVVLPAKACRTSGGETRFKRGEPFFGEVIAHSPSFTDETKFVCIGSAVWGCAAPEPTPENVAY